MFVSTVMCVRIDGGSVFVLTEVVCLYRQRVCASIDVGHAFVLMEFVLTVDNADSGVHAGG